MFRNTALSGTESSVSDGLLWTLTRAPTGDLGQRA